MFFATLQSWTAIASVVVVVQEGQPHAGSGHKWGTVVDVLILYCFQNRLAPGMFLY
jgi:hypothetical protein